MTSKPLVRRTLATLRNAELGFFGVVVYTRVHTPRFCGDLASAGTLLFIFGEVRAFRTNWLIVGIIYSPKKPGTASPPSLVCVASATAPGLPPERRVKRRQILSAVAWGVKQPARRLLHPQWQVR